MLQLEANQIQDSLPWHPFGWWRASMRRKTLASSAFVQPQRQCQFFQLPHLFTAAVWLVEVCVWIIEVTHRKNKLETNKETMFSKKTCKKIMERNKIKLQERRFVYSYQNRSSAQAGTPIPRLWYDSVDITSWQLHEFIGRSTCQNISKWFL